MTKKEYLSRAMEYEIKIRASLEYIAALKVTATKVNTILSDMPGAGFREQSKLERIIIEIMMLEDEVKDNVEEMGRLKKEIEDVINSLDSVKERIVLSLRYVYMMDWDNICQVISCSKRYVYVIHKRALNNLQIPPNYSKCIK